MTYSDPAYPPAKRQCLKQIWAPIGCHTYGTAYKGHAAHSSRNWFNLTLGTALKGLLFRFSCELRRTVGSDLIVLWFTKQSTPPINSKASRAFDANSTCQSVWGVPRCFPVPYSFLKFPCKEKTFILFIRSLKTGCSLNWKL